MNGCEFGFSRSYFQRVFVLNNVNFFELCGECEEIFLFFGGKLKLVCFEINLEGLNLLEKEWCVEFKFRDLIFCNLDEEGL